MNGNEILRIVDAIHRDKAIHSDVVFEGIEQAILSAARKHFSEEEQLEVRIDRETGEPSLICDGATLDPELLGDLLGRISAQTAKQVMIQKIREAERDTLYEEYLELRSQQVSGQVTRVDRGTVIVNLGKVEAILPRSEQIRKENYRTGDRVRAIVLDVRKTGSRVRVILSRTHPDFVRRLFEVEIPEVNDRIIEVRSIAREAGNRSKVAVSCSDSSIDCVGACVGVRGARIRGIVEELAGERIDIVRWNDSLQILVPNAMQPAEVEDVILCPMLGKVIVLVREDQLSLAIGKFGQNVRLASKLVGWDINVMTQTLLDQQLDKSIEAFCVVPEVTSDLAENLVSQGFFTFDDLSVIEPDQLVEISGLTPEECDKIVEFADVESARLEIEERIAAEQRKLNAHLEATALPKQKTASPKSEIAEVVQGDSGDANRALEVGESQVAEAVEPQVDEQVKVVTEQDDSTQAVAETVPQGAEIETVPQGTDDASSTAVGEG
ncbi:MAG TPA: transcription termination factor NusA [Planctomycetaceae bacterium]|nr:transcription termination factor NusA [Planctomycetaceae bacterium]HQZ64310.1 transcription termination factor NusA [Planctomycetaceae bacterium]